jgi:hypothetical protein
MKISPDQRSFKTRTYWRQIAVPAMKAKAWRAVKAAAPVALPLIGTVAVGALAYHVSTDFRDCADWVRGKLDQYPRAAEMASSGFTMGFLPDFLAQRYEGNKHSLRRSLGMTAIGAVVGGVLCRELYDWQNKLFPGAGFSNTIKKILFDQGNWTPVYLFSYLTCTNLIKGATPKTLFNNVWNKMVKILPSNWAYWGLMALPILYNLPQDLKVYAAQFFCVIWNSFQSKVAFDPSRKA